jgi:hypothetical protein
MQAIKAADHHGTQQVALLPAFRRPFCPHDSNEDPENKMTWEAGECKDTILAACRT